MELAIKNKTENKALGRTEISCVAAYGKAMPSRKELREAICAAIGTDPSLLVIVSAKGGFGSQSANVLAHAYKDKAAMSVAGKHLLVRDGLMEKQKKAAKAAKTAKK